MIIKNKSIHLLVFWAFIVLLFSYQYDKMFFVDQEIILNYFNYLYAPLLICTICTLYVFLYKYHCSWRKVINSIIVFITVLTILTIMWSLFSPLKAKVVYIYVISIGCVFYYSLCLPSIISVKNFNLGILALYILFVLVYIFGYRVQTYNNISSQTNASYTILYTLPLVLCIRNKSINIAALVVTLIVVFTSLKRGGIIAYSIGLLSYVYTKYLLTSKKNLLLRTIGLLLILVFFVFLFLYVNQSTDGVILDRLESIEDDGGSGRIDIWHRVIQAISSSSVISLIFGHGWDSVYEDIGFSAHNDFLEIIYDFGIIVFFIFLRVLHKLIKFTKVLILQKSFFGPVMVCSLSIFLVNSTVSHIVIYPHYFILFLLCWGYILNSHIKMYKSTSS